MPAVQPAGLVGVPQPAAEDFGQGGRVRRPVHQSFDSQRKSEKLSPRRSARRVRGPATAESSWPKASGAGPPRPKYPATIFSKAIACASSHIFPPVAGVITKRRFRTGIHGSVAHPVGRAVVLLIRGRPRAGGRLRRKTIP